MRNKILILLSFITYVGSAQIKIQNLSLTKPDTNLLYLGRENILTVSGIKTSDYTILSTSSKIKTLHGIVSVFPEQEKFDTIKVAKEGKVLLQKIFQIVSFPKVTFSVSGTMDTLIPKDILLRYPMLLANLPKCIYKLRYRIYYFELTIQSKNRKSTKCESNSYKYSDEVIDLIKLLSEGDILYFDNVKATCPDCNLKNLGSRKIIVR